MPTDTERREVARRLRDEAAHGEMHIRDFLDALCACIKTERNAYRALLRLADLIEPGEPEVRCVAEVKVDGERLEKLVHDAAVEMLGKMRHSTKEEADAYDVMLKSKSVEIHPVDCDALLELADKIAEAADYRMSRGEICAPIGIYVLRGYVRRIREALGVER